VCKYLLERSKSVLHLLYLSPGQISLRAVPDLHLLTAAHSQIKFDVGTNVFVCSLVAGLSMPTCHGVHRHAWSSMYICGCSICKVALICRTNSKFLFSSNSYVHMHCCMTYRQISLYIWALNQALAPRCTWWQSSFPRTMNCESLDWHLWCRCWFIFVTPQPLRAWWSYLSSQSSPCTKMPSMAEFFPWNYELWVAGLISSMQMLIYLCNTPTTPGLMVITPNTHLGS
jgi:hypothetical protein